MKTPRSKRHYTVTEAAQALGVTRAAVHKAIRNRRLKAEWGEVVQVTKGLRIPAQSLRDYEVDSLQQERGKKTSPG
jgi:excisionase family DNA binding protein